MWNNLLDNPAFLANAIESERAVAGHKIIGRGMGLFVSGAFADVEITRPRPDVK